MQTDTPATRGSLGALILIAWLAVLACVTWFVVDPLKDHLFAAFLASGRSPSVADAARVVLANLDVSQVVLLACAAGLGLGLIVAELRWQAVSAMLRAQSRGLLVCYFALVLWFGHSYIGHGYLLSGDTIAHIMLIATRIRAVLSGAYPYWSNFEYQGSALLGFYSPTTMWPIVWLGALSGDMMWGIKAFLFFAHVLSGAGLFLLARQLGLGRLGAFFAGLAYSGSFAHLHMILYRGELPQALILALLPFIFLFLHRVLTGAGRTLLWDWAGLVVVAAGLVVNYAPIGPVLAIYLTIFSFWTMAQAGVSVRRIAGLAIGGMLSLALAAFVLLPGALNKSDVLPVAQERLISLAIPSLAYLRQLLTWSAWRTNFPGAQAYLGIVSVLLATGAMGNGLLRSVAGKRIITMDGTAENVEQPSRRSAVPLLAVLFGLSLVLRGAHVRDIMFTLLFTALLAGCGAEVLLTRLRAYRFAPALLLGLMVLDLGSTSVQPIARTDKGWQDAAGTYLAEQAIPTRTLNATIVDGKLVPDDAWSILLWYPAEFLTGGHVEMATPVWTYSQLAQILAEEDLNGLGHLRPQTRDLLCLIRIGRIVGMDRTSMGLPKFMDGEEEGPLGRVVKTACPYQLVFAPVLTTADFPGLDPHLDYRTDRDTRRLPEFRVFLKRMLSAMGLDPATGNASTILVREAVPAAPTTPATGSAPIIRLERYRVTSDRVHIAFSSASQGFVRVSHAWHPALSVTLNGQAATVYRDIMGFIVVAVPAGQSTLEIRSGPEYWQIVGERISLVATFGLLTVLSVGFWIQRFRK